MKPYKELAGQTVIYGLGTIIPRILNFLLTPLYTYTLLEADFGIITELYAYVAFFMVLLTFGMETTFFRYTNKVENKNYVFNNAFGTLFSLSSLFLVFVLFFRKPIAGIIGYENNHILLVYLAGIVFFDVITAIPLAQLRQDNKARFFAIIRTSNVLINISLNLFFFVICKDSNNNFFGSLYNENIGVGYAFISNLVASGFNFLILIPVLFKFNFSFNKSVFKSMFKYAAPLVIVGFCGMVNEVADKLFIKYLTPIEMNPLKQVGIYGANYKLAVLMTIFIQMFKYAAEPFFFKQEKSSNAKEIYSKVMTYFVIFCIAILLLVTLYIDVFQLFMGENYRVGLHIVPIILLANMFLGIYYNLSVWYKLNNLTHYAAYISLFGVIITVVLNFVLIPIIGYTGSAIATLACYASMVVISYFFGRKYYLINYQVTRIVLYIGFGVLIMLISSLINTNYAILNLFIATSFFIFYFVIVFKVESINFDTLKRFIKK